MRMGAVYPTHGMAEMEGELATMLPTANVMHPSENEQRLCYNQGKEGSQDAMPAVASTALPIMCPTIPGSLYAPDDPGRIPAAYTAPGGDYGGGN